MSASSSGRRSPPCPRRPGSRSSASAVEECTERIEISFGEYESVRANPRAFVVVAGHADPECERVVAVRDGYEVVEKYGDAGVVAELEDPRDVSSEPRVLRGGRG